VSEDGKKQSPPKPDTSIRGKVTQGNPSPRQPDRSIRGHSNKGKE
jgi:hypothetical protein